ncbi:MAG: hypothetical protein ACP5IL_09535 [Syntrophobacteraceae bacterium]
MVVQGETLDQVFSQTFCGPTAELDAAFRAKPLADREDSFKIILFDQTSDRSLSFLTNYPEFPDSSFRFELIIGILEDDGEVVPGHASRMVIWIETKASIGLCDRYMKSAGTTARRLLLSLNDKY